MNERMLQIFEDSKLSPAQRRAKKRKEAAIKAANEKENLLKSLLAPHRFTTDQFLREQERLAFNFLIRLGNKIFDYDGEGEHYELVVTEDGKKVKEMVYLWKVKKSARPFFDAVKNTKGFLGFITWVHDYGEFEKKCTAETVVKDVSWVLRYGKDKAGALKDLDRKSKETWEAQVKGNTSIDAPKMAHSLSSKRTPNQRILRSLLKNNVKKNLWMMRRPKKAAGEVLKLERLMNSEAVRRDLVKKDEFLFSLTRVSETRRNRFNKSALVKEQPAAGLLKSK